MSQKKIDILQRSLQREKAARKIAEKILEDKSRDLFFMSEKLKESNEKLEKLLEEKSYQLQGIFDNINDAYVVMNLDGDILKMNDNAQNLFGYQIDKESVNVAQLVFKDDWIYAQKSYKQLIEKGSFTNYKARIITKNKQIRWVQINGSIVLDKQKKPIAAQGIIRDITLDVFNEKKQKESENRLSSLLLNLENGVLLEDENGKVILANKKFCEIFEIPVAPDELKGLDCALAAESSKLLFSNPEAFIQNINKLLKDKKQVLAQELIMKNGLVLERDFIPIRLDNEYKGHLWSYRDITLKKKYNKSIESQKEKYSNIIANMNLGLLEVDLEDKIIMANNSFCKMSGFNEKELLGKKGSDILLSDKDRFKLLHNNENRKTGLSNSYELNIKNKKGENRVWLISGAPNYNLNGEIVGSIGIHLDITKLKSLEKQKATILKELENSNEELKEYAHIVSHDLKSPLRSIDALISWIKMDNVGVFDELTMENFGLIEETLETMETLISNILEYSSAGSKAERDQQVDLNKLLEKLKNTLYIPENISLNILNKLPNIKGDETKLQQLFQNLISNGIKFCDKKEGFVEVDYQDQLTFHQFMIKDNGIGIDKKYHDKIFQVFHSLNKRKDSTGIGLSIVKKIIDLYEGDIWLESEPGQGTTFYFTIKKS